MPITAISSDDVADAQADEIIAKCVTASPPVSFFLFAGAGSGKTRSLVQALRVIESEVAGRFRLHGRQVGVITFTNKACDEIKSRLEYDPLFAVSTIHSFAWSLISGLNSDIREWLKGNLRAEIEELAEKERNGRPGTKASQDRQDAMAAKNERLANLDAIKIFIYNPDGDNPERNALNHAEVIKITSAFLSDKPMMQKILVNRFPILLVDESQDMDKLLMDALFYTQTMQSAVFALGIIGDMMQRIYMAGKMDLGSDLPDDWEKPQKLMNHRSGRRIVKLINRIRAPVDDHAQRCRADRGEGVVRLFIVPADIADKSGRENTIYLRMAEITGDQSWGEPRESVKTLILEHHMAARRLGFLPLWDALRSINHLQTGLRDGSLPPLRFFSQVILPFVKNCQNGDRFGVASVVRKHSPLLDRGGMEARGADQATQIVAAKQAVTALAKLWSDGNSPTFLDVLYCVKETGLFAPPEAIRTFSATIEGTSLEADMPEQNEGDEVAAWRTFLETPFCQIEPYSQYIQGEAAYDTHQGIKGLEFPRVCVIMDDTEARGFMFSYEKLFGAKADSSRADPTRESSMDRTRRLFYVTCSRAEDSLALIAYSTNPQKVREHALSEGWFEETEIEVSVP
jgi:DNA helicase-2/ATP-dependent DNA helicase PcrA